MTISNPGDLVPIFVIASIVLGALVWIIRAQLSMEKQFKPNGGASLRDSIDRLERNDNYLRDRLDAHIDQHQKGQS
jgi:hypothetical protein